LFFSALMTLTEAIEHHRQALAGIVAMLCAWAGLDDGDEVGRLSGPLCRAIFRVLRPAESAVRRLIVVAAHGLVMEPRAVRPAPAGLVIPRSAKGRLSFRLFDPPHRPGRTQVRHRGGPVPRIRLIDTTFDPRVPLFRQFPSAEAAPQPDGTVNAAPLNRRLLAIRRALDDLPREARRYARWLARPLEARRPRLVSPLRFGTPPGHRKESREEVHAILAACDQLARQATAPDSS
jgi:hypothetical protein